MGRPSRKRPRESERESSTRKQPLPLDRHPSYPFGKFSNSGLESLVKGRTTSDSKCADRDGAGADDKTAMTTAVVQGIWGGMAEADIAAASSTLRVGLHVDIDSAGVAWLVNTSIHENAAEVGKTQVVLLSGSQGCNQRARDHGVPSEGTAPPAACRDLPPASGRSDGGMRRDEARDTAPPSAALFDACEPSLRDQLSRVKREFDEIPPVVFKRARSACNPAEALGSGSFLNRSAMKLANIDAILGGKLSLPSGPSSQEGAAAKITPPPEGGATREPSRFGESPPTLLFADLCGGPGGFSEYLLRRRRRLGLPARGWGISLREGAGGAGIRGDDTDAVEDAAVDDHSKKCGFVQKTGNVVLDPGGYHRIPPVPTPAGEDGGSTLAEETPAPKTTSVMPGVASGVGSEAREGASRDGCRRSEKQGRDDPCAWQLDHLRPWCEVSAPGIAVAAPTGATERSQGGGGHEKADCTPADASSTAANVLVCTSSSATAAAAGDAMTTPLLVMRIDYGPKGTGDVTDEENLQGFVESVLASTGGRRLGLVVADGGFGAARDDPEQERVLSALLHAEALAALLLLEEGGSFVCKLFECWTESTAALVYLLHRKFRRIAIVKPITSRPASGERYLVCAGFSAPPSTPYFCPFTDLLRAKVKAMQDVRRHRTGPGRSPTPLDPRNMAPQTAHQTTESPGHHGKATSAHDGAGVGGGGCDASVVGELDVALGVETEMKHDVRFVSYLRLSNNALASLQAKACSRIVEVASTKRGRAWAFRDSNTSRSSGGTGRSDRVGSGVVHDVRDSVGGVKDGDDAAAARCFRRAWGLDGL